MAKLVILSGEFEGRSFDLIDNRITVGRSSDNNIHIDDKTVSSRHATLVFNGQEYILKDLNSTNGTRVNDRRITDTKLSNGDHIRFGGVELQYESEKPKHTQPLPPLSTGVDLTAGSQTVVIAPTSIGNVSPFQRRKNKTTLILNAIIALLLIVALVILSALILKWSES